MFARTQGKRDNNATFAHLPSKNLDSSEST